MKLLLDAFIRASQSYTVHFGNYIQSSLHQVFVERDDLIARCNFPPMFSNVILLYVPLQLSTPIDREPDDVLDAPLY